MLPSGARRRGAGGADAEPGRRPDDARDRARLPRLRADARAAARPREAEDPRRRHPAAGAAGAPAAGAAARPRCATVYLVFNAGYGPPVRRELCAEAIRLAAVLRRSCPTRPRCTACTRCCCSRTPAATPASPPRASSSCSRPGPRALGRDRDRARPPRARPRARAARPGPYQLQAAIASLHVEPETDWQQIALLYERLAELAPSPVVELNRAVAVAFADGPRPGSRSRTRSPGSATTTSGTRRGPISCTAWARDAEAAEAYERALELAPGDVEQEFIRRRLAELRQP